MKVPAAQEKDESFQLGPVQEDDQRRMSKASTATGGADEPEIGNGGTEISEGYQIKIYKNSFYR